MKKLIVGLLVLTMAVSMFGCKKKSEVTETTEEVETMATNHNGEVRSYLTGKWVSKEVAAQRPLACMISNQPEAPNQSGISQASIVYEVPGEDNYATRFMGIFEDWEDIKQIGSVRSCRTYYVYYMLEFDSIYAHAGQCAYALPTLEQDFVDNISSVKGTDANAFFIVEEANRSKEHKLHTSGEKILEKAKEKGYSLTHDSDYQGHYIFNEDDDNLVTPEGGETAEIVVPGYSINKPWFAFDSDKHVYYRYQYRKELGESKYSPVKQTDRVNNEVLEYNNIILQYSSFGTYDDTHYWNIDCVSGGKGKFITNGKAIDITWKKDSEYGVTHYYDLNGKEITLNQGKTWVCIINNKDTDKIEITTKANAKNPDIKEAK